MSLLVEPVADEPEKQAICNCELDKNRFAAAYPTLPAITNMAMAIAAAHLTKRKIDRPGCEMKSTRNVPVTSAMYAET